MLPKHENRVAEFAGEALTAVATIRGASAFRAMPVCCGLDRMHDLAAIYVAARDAAVASIRHRVARFQSSN